MVSKRWAPDGERRCNHDTSRGEYCWQHLKQLAGFRIKKDDGLVTTRPRQKNTVVTSFNPPGVAAFAHPSIRPNTRVSAQKLKATKDIPANTIVTVPAGGKSVPTPVPAPIQKKKLKLVKPYYDPKWDEPLHEPVRESEPKPKKPRKKIYPSEKFERQILKRLKVLQELFSDKKMAERLKIQPSKHVIKIPQRDDVKDIDKVLNKLLIKERKRWVAYINQNPRNAMTDNKAYDLIEKLAKEK